MPVPPGACEVDPSVEAWRLAKARMETPEPVNREWGVRHPDGFVSVTVSGQAYQSRVSAGEARAACDDDCGWCESTPHTLVWRDRPQWRDEHDGDGSADYSGAAR